MSGPVGVGVISDTYLEHLTAFPDLNVMIVGDLDAGGTMVTPAPLRLPEERGNV